MEWDEAIEEAKEELGISGYTNNWDEVVETAKDIIAQEKEDEEYNMSEEELKSREAEKEDMKRINQDEYKDYLKSDRWKILREEALNRDNYKCKKCGKAAEEVHHTRYDHKGTPWEIHTIISLCKDCHKSEHKKKTIFK